MINEGYANESVLSKSDRDNLSKSDFGIPETRSFPMPDKNHVKAAISMFNKAPDNKKSELAKAISKKSKEFGMSDLKDSKVIGRYL